MTILLITQDQMTLGCVRRHELHQKPAESRAKSVLIDHRNRERGGKILLTTASLPIRTSAQFVFMRANRGKQPRRIANTHAHTAGSSLWACKQTSMIYRAK